jgi:hypothetical protein
VNYANSKGIVLQLILLDCWHSGRYGKNHGFHDLDFYKQNNNVNGKNFGTTEEWQATSGPIWDLHSQFVKKIIDTVGSKPNVIWETCNENTGSQSFDEAIATLVAQYETTKGFQNKLIVGWPSSSGKIHINEHMKVAGHKTPADNSAQSVEAMRQQLATSQWSWNSPLITDNDCCGGQPSASLVRRKAWLALTAGTHTSLFNSESYRLESRISDNFALYLKELGYLSKFIKLYGPDLASMAPAPNDNSVVNRDVAYALYSSNKEYIVYFPFGGTSVIQNINPAQYSGIWFDPQTGKTQPASLSGQMSTPNDKDWVLYLKNTSQLGSCNLPEDSGSSSYTPPTLAHVRNLNGLIHRPTTIPYTKLLQIDVPTQTRYRFMEMSIDVKVTQWNLDWNGDPKKDWHMAYWLQRGNRWQSYSPQYGNVLGMVNIYPQGGSVVVNFQSNIHGNGRDQMFLIKGNADIQTGRTYRFKQIYDAEGGTITLEIFYGSQKIFSQSGPAYAHIVDTLGNNHFQLGLSNAHDDAGPESPSVNWEYSNFELKLYQ